MTEASPDRRIGDELAWLEGVIKRAGAYAEHLSDRDIHFVDSIRIRLWRYGASAFLSPRQRAWMESISRRLDEAGAPADPDDPGDTVARPVDEKLR